MGMLRRCRRRDRGYSVVSGIHRGRKLQQEMETSPLVLVNIIKMFIVIKNLSRTPFTPSQPNPELIGHHVKETRPGDQGHNGSDSTGQPETTT